MIKCICIDDKNRPSKIPEEKWVVVGQEYTIQFAIMVVPQGTLAFQLEEIELGPECFPWEFFLASRFSFAHNDVHELLAFIQECAKIYISVKQLLNQTRTHEGIENTGEED